jgi:hypothetical protein
MFAKPRDELVGQFVFPKVGSGFILISHHTYNGNPRYFKGKVFLLVGEEEHQYQDLHIKLVPLGFSRNL